MINLFAVMKAAGSVCFIVFLSNMSLSEAVCKGSAKYKLTFKPEWTIVTHPSDFPLGPHFSSVVGCSHNPSYVMWKPGMKATAGVQLVAETGSTYTINIEMDQQISLKTAFYKFQGNVISNVGTSVVSDIQVNTNYPLVSAISMIAPSPDWFVGVRDHSLCNDTTGKWIDKSVKDLPLYDAGTDSAKSFVHINTPTSPHVPIFRITKIPEDSTSNEMLKRFGTFTFEKTFESIDDDVISSTSSVATSVNTRSSIMIEAPNPSTSKAKSTIILANTEGTLKPIISYVTSNAMSPSTIATKGISADTSSVTTPAAMPPSTTIEVTNLGTTKAKSSIILAKTEGTLKPIISKATSNVTSPSTIARTTPLSSSNTPTSGGESSIVHFGVFVFLKLMILNLFSADFLKV